MTKQSRDSLRVGVQKVEGVPGRGEAEGCLMSGGAVEVGNRLPGRSKRPRLVLGLEEQQTNTHTSIDLTLEMRTRKETHKLTSPQIQTEEEEKNTHLLKIMNISSFKGSDFDGHDLIL